MRHLAIGVALLAAVLLAGCGSSRFIRYDGPEVTRVVVLKEQRKMILFHQSQPLATYDISLGWSPIGHKTREGDGRTPEGRYYIDRRNPESKFHLSLGISYPNRVDMERARSMGVKPGGDIFIHGWSNSIFRRRGSDWTWGCIAVRDRDIEQIYAMVGDGTPIDIYR